MKFGNEIFELLGSDKRKCILSHIFERQLLYFIENKYGWLMENHDQTLRRKAMRMQDLALELTRYKCDKPDSMLELSQIGGGFGRLGEVAEEFMVRGKVYRPVMGNSIGQGRISPFFHGDQKEKKGRVYSPYRRPKMDVN